MAKKRLEEYDAFVADVLYSDTWRMFNDLDKYCRLLNVFKLRKMFMDHHTVTGEFDLGLGSGQNSLLGCLRAQQEKERQIWQTTDVDAISRNTNVGSIHQIS